MADSLVQSLGSRSDPTYFARHDRRNGRRVSAVIQSLTAGERMLDIGCNRGYFSQAILEAGLARQIDAIDVERSTVNPLLLSDERFTLFEGDATRFDFRTDYWAILYCAVHHHVHRTHGNLEAFRFWRRIVDHCQRHIVFETGQLFEGSRWDWQRSLRLHYPSDEEYVGSLLHAIGSRLEGVVVLGTFSIHGTRRWLLRIDLHPKSLTESGEASMTEDGVPEDSGAETYYRSLGSRRQQLVRAPIKDTTALVAYRMPSPPLHEGTVFALRNRGDDDMLHWCKKSTDDPFRNLREFHIGSQVDRRPFVRPLSLDARWGLVFPFVDGEKLSDVDLARTPNKKQVVDELLDIFDQADKIAIDTGDLDIDPRARGSRRRLIDLVDLHPANMLVVRDGTLLGLSAIVDLEYFRNHNKARNALHLAKLVLRGRVLSLRAALFLAKTLVWTVRHHVKWCFAPLSDRLYERYTSPAKALALRARETVDRALYPLPGYWQ